MLIERVGPRRVYRGRQPFYADSPYAILPGRLTKGLRRQFARMERQGGRGPAAAQHQSMLITGYRPLDHGGSK